MHRDIQIICKLSRRKVMRFLSKLYALLVQERLIEEANYFWLTYYPQKDSGYFIICLRESEEAALGVYIENKPMNDERENENKDWHVYKDFYIEYILEKGCVDIGGGAWY